MPAMLTVARRRNSLANMPLRTAWQGMTKNSCSSKVPRCTILRDPTPYRASTLSTRCLRAKHFAAIYRRKWGDSRDGGRKEVPYIQLKSALVENDAKIRREIKRVIAGDENKRDCFIRYDRGATLECFIFTIAPSCANFKHRAKERERGL